MALSREDRERIDQEERYRAEAREKAQRTARSKSTARGCGGCLAVVAIGLIFIGWVASQRSSLSLSGSPTGASSIPAKVRTKDMGETLKIGYTSYCVWKAWWSDRLSGNQFLDKRANAKWLFLDVSVRNDDTKPRSIPPFTLIDESGSEYESSAQGMMLESSIGVLDSLNPGVTKQGRVVFDVPTSHFYRLKASGGYWSGETAYIYINNIDTEK